MFNVQVQQGSGQDSYGLHVHFVVDCYDNNFVAGTSEMTSDKGEDKQRKGMAQDACEQMMRGSRMQGAIDYYPHHKQYT